MSDFQYYFTKRRINKTLKTKLSDRLDTEGLSDTNAIKSEKDMIDDLEIKKLKDEYAETELNLLLKNRILCEINKQYNTNKAKIKDIDYDTIKMTESLSLIKEELTKLKSEQSKQTIIKHNPSHSKNKTYNYNNISKEFNILNNKHAINKKEYARLIEFKLILNNKLTILEELVYKQDQEDKTLSNNILNIQKNLNNNKLIYKKIEDNINYKLYFIRFSNSLVRSLFNIINIRRLQIDMIKTLTPDELKQYGNFFKKLDEMEKTLIIEYNEFLKYGENIFNF